MWVPVEGIEPPYDVCLVQLGGVQVFGHIVGIEVEAPPRSIVHIRVDTSKAPPYWFELDQT